MKELKLEIPADCEVDKIETQDGHIVVTFREKKRKLPKSWEEFCRMYPIKKGEFRIATSSVLLKAKDNPPFDNGEKIRYFSDTNILPDRATAEAVLALSQLIQLRECYNDGWKPDWSGGEEKYCIEFYANKVDVEHWECRATSPLYFKSEELRELFLENFRDLIEKLKPLYGITKGGEE